MDFTDSQNYALSGDMQFHAVKCEEVGAVTRKYDAAHEKGGDNFKKSDFTFTVCKKLNLQIRAVAVFTIYRAQLKINARVCAA